MTADSNTAIDIQVSFIVSALDAMRTLELTFVPVLLRYAARRYLVAIEATKTMMVGIEYSTSSGTKIFSIDSIIICKPTAMMTMAMIMVDIRSIFALWFESLWWLANFSQTMMINPETESVKLWIASEIIAMELDNSPTIMLNTASKKFIAIKI